MALEELKEDDAVIEIAGIEIGFNRQEKLYVHKCTVDYSQEFPGDGFKVTPWFNGFVDC